MDEDGQTPHERTLVEEQADRAAILADLGFDEAAAIARARVQQARVRRLEARLARRTDDLRRVGDRVEDSDAGAADARAELDRILGR